MRPFWKANHPLVLALTAFAVLFCFLILFAAFFDFTHINTGALLFLASTMTCAFIAKNIYDIARASEQSVNWAHDLADELISSSQELFTELYYNSPVPYLLIDHSGTIISANVAAIRLFNMPQDRLEGANVFGYLFCEPESHLDMMIEKYRSGVAVNSEEVQVKRGRGDTAWALLSLFRFSSVRDRQLGMLTLVDVSRQKETERAKSEFVSLASHQLRTPIAGMKWSAELLLMDGLESLSDRQQKYIHRLIASIERMGVLVDDFLRVSRFELGTFKLEQKTFNIRELITDVLSDQEVKVQQKHITVKTFFDERVSEMVSDPDLLRMIVTNLYTNAVKYTREYGTVHIGYAQRLNDLVFTVADNGMGIPPAEQEHVFSKLFRASNATKQVPDGTGLGLYIVREAVRVLRGNITFTSAENMGTTFEVIIPLVPGAEAQGGVAPTR